ncbi:MAG: GTP-binding protein [Bilophila wadsworthia]
MRKKLIILSGFLGSGKTTLLRSLLLHHSNRKVAVLLNDFGDIPVDGETLRRSGVEGGVVVEIGGGSVFCSCLREPFIKALANLAARDEDLIIVEASGMSDPSAVDKMLRLSGLDGLFEHTSTICLFDPVKSLKLARVLEVIPRQLASASVVVLTKADITTTEEREAARAYIRSLEPDLPIVKAITETRILPPCPNGRFACFRSDSIPRRRGPTASHWKLSGPTPRRCSTP